jgi:lipopolysaccharide/colanic/teichoic acid biosynthesis glycosyltransferase
MSSNPESDYVNQIMPDKIRLNLGYAALADLWTDFRLVITTFARIAMKQEPQG